MPTITLDHFTSSTVLYTNDYSWTNTANLLDSDTSDYARATGGGIFTRSSDRLGLYNWNSVGSIPSTGYQITNIKITVYGNYVYGTGYVAVYFGDATPRSVILPYSTPSEVTVGDGDLAYWNYYSGQTAAQTVIENTSSTSASDCVGLQINNSVISGDHDIYNVRMEVDYELLKGGILLAK